MVTFDISTATTREAQGPLYWRIQRYNQNLTKQSKFYPFIAECSSTSAWGQCLPLLLEVMTEVINYAVKRLNQHNFSNTMSDVR